MRASPHSARLWAAIALTLFVGTLVVGAAFSSSTGAAGQRSTRKMSLTVSQPGTVVSGATVTMRAKARDQAGRPIKGAAVTFWWRLPNGRCSHSATTNAKGAAVNSHVTDCGSAAEFQAKVVVTARWHGQVRRVTRHFNITGGT